MSDDLTCLVLDASGAVVRVAVGVPETVPHVDGETVVLRGDAAADAWTGWIRQVDGSYVDPHAPKPPTATQLLAYANGKRKAISEGTGGAQGRLIPVTIASGTIAVPIDATTRAALDAAAFQTTLPNGNAYAIDSWLLPTGAFISLDAQSIMTVAQAVGAAFQSLFSAQKAAFADIAAGRTTTTAQVDATLAASAPAGSVGG